MKYLLASLYLASILLPLNSPQILDAQTTCYNQDYQQSCLANQFEENGDH